MIEKKKIRKGLALKGRNAYLDAKKNGYAFIAIGNSIYKMSADGTKEKVEELMSTRVKTKQKRFSL